MSDRMNASEWLERLADAMETMRQPQYAQCKEPGCGNRIPRGTRCEPCQKKYHAAIERARFAQKKRKTA